MNKPHNRLFPGDILQRLDTPSLLRNQPDNVYADSEPPHPERLIGKKFTAAATQTKGGSKLAYRNNGETGYGRKRKRPK